MAAGSSGMPSRSGSRCTTRYSNSGPEPVPNGPRPVAAKASTAPSEKTSAAGVTSRPSACSGDM
ncbi:hypothetical protein GCM10010246_08760 [Streptomyces cuspidosporus]|uniref:Uncharacterized protein n=1 Tax=Streptomyces cuspidosporus TaxID=66882 RepID=A0ABP5SCR9_9ACTN